MPVDPARSPSAVRAPLSAESFAHAQSMDRIYGWQRAIYNVTRRYYLIGRDRLIAGLHPPDGSVVLEIGCGTARNLVAIGKAYPQARLIGLDISDVMLEEAAKAMRQAGFGYRTRLVRADAANFDAKRLFNPTPIDRIVMSYTLSMIPNWQGALQQALPMLPPGGELHIVDFGTMDKVWAPLKMALRRWLATFSVTPRESLVPHLEGLCDGKTFELKLQSLGGGYAMIAVIRRL